MAEIISKTWRELEDKIKAVLAETPVGSFRTLSITRPDGSMTNYSSWSDLSTLLREVVARRKDEESSAPGTSPENSHGFVCITGHNGFGW